MGALYSSALQLHLVVKPKFNLSCENWPTFDLGDVAAIYENTSFYLYDRLGL